MRNNSNEFEDTTSSGAFDLSGDRLVALDKMPQIDGVVFWEWHIKKGLRVFSKEFNKMMLKNVPVDQRTDPFWWHSLIHEDDVDAATRVERDLLENRSAVCDSVFRIKTGDSCWTWCNSRGQVVERENGEPSVVVGILTHIPKLRVHRETRHSGVGVDTPGYHALLENSPDLYMRMNQELVPLYINPAMVGYAGIARDGRSFDRPPDGTKLNREYLVFLCHNVRRVFEGGPAIRETVSFRIHDGAEATGEYAFWPEYDADGSVVSVMTHFRDCTKHIHAEYAVSQDDRRLAALNELSQMEAGPEDDMAAFIIDSLIDLTGSEWGFVLLPGDDEAGSGKLFWSYDQCRYVDDQCRTGSGLPPDLQALANGVTGDTVFPNVLNGGGTGPVYIWADGGIPVLRSIIAASTGRGGQALIAGVCNKKSDYLDCDLRQLQYFINGACLRLRHRRLVDELNIAKEAVKEATEAVNEAKNLFLSNISHELRTPLNGLLGMLQLFDTRHLSPEQCEYIKAATFAGNTLLRIISDILDFSHIEAGRMELVPDVFDLKDSLGTSLRVFKEEVEARGLLFEIDIDEKIPDALIGDDTRVRQIVFNLVGNSLKFTDSGKITVRCQLQGQDANGRVELRITVSDTGIGIPLEEQDLVFEGFTQLDTSKIGCRSGTGLGLSIVKRLAAMMDGSIEIDSAPGIGTSIHCTFALDAADQGEKGVAAPTAVHADKTLPMDILVAEDDSVSAFAMRVFLERLGHRAVCVENGKKALEALQLHNFDCILTDIHMPEMSGLELAERIRQGRLQEVPPTESTRRLLSDFLNREIKENVSLNSAIPIVAVSAHVMDGDRERFFRHGVTDYIQKPVIMARLGEVLNRLCG